MSGGGTKKNLLIGGRETRGQAMENNNEFVDYIKRNPEAIKDNFRRKTTVQCLEDYAEELARRRNFYKGYTE